MEKEETGVLVALVMLFVLFAAFQDTLIQQDTVGKSIIDDIDAKIPLPINNTTVIIGGVIIAVILVMLILIVLKTKKRHKLLTEKKKKYIPALQKTKDVDKHEEQIDELFSQDLDKYLHGNLKLDKMTKTSKKKKSHVENKAHSVLFGETKQVQKVPPTLINYIKHGQEKKIPRNNIYGALIKAGWKDEQVKQALKTVDQEKMLNYVQFALKHNQSEQQIVGALLKAGWNLNEAKKAVGAAKTKFAFTVA
tara:strand:- start:127 stop:876 length:750 start_codon:yes stop_codon:yes gene_type:complete